MVPAGDTASAPLVAFVPVQPPLAAHANALVEDQVTVEVLPELMLAGLAEIVTVGDRLGKSPQTAQCRGREHKRQGQRPGSRGRALRSKETKAKLKLTPYEPKIYRFGGILDCAAIKPSLANCG